MNKQDIIFKPPISIPFHGHFDNKPYLLRSLDQSVAEFSPKLTATLVNLCNEELIYNNIFRFRLSGKPYSENEATEFLNKIYSNWSDQAKFTFGIFDDNSKLVATADIKSCNRKKAEVGYWCSQSVRGIMTNAVTSLVELAKSAGYEKLFSYVETDNLLSQNLLKRVHFSETRGVNHPTRDVVCNYYELNLQ